MHYLKLLWKTLTGGTSGPRQRLQPGGSIAIVMTRWSQKDLTAQLVKKMGDLKADKWDIECRLS